MITQIIIITAAINPPIIPPTIAPALLSSPPSPTAVVTGRQYYITHKQ